MKAKREHRVPLTAAVLAVLKAMEAIRQSDYVFPGIGGGRLGINSLHFLLSTMGEGVSVHGFRSTFRDWAAERTNFPRELAEKALAHTVGDETERAYQRGDLLEKRRKLMEAWAEFCGSPAASGRVVSIVGRRGGDDLAKAKILLACAMRVYGPNKEADEYNRDEYNGFLKMGCKIAGIEIETLGQVSVEEVVATMLAEDREAARAAPVPPKRGRPPTPHRHLWITVSIEAYRGIMGLRRKAAEIRAAREWDLHPSTIGKVYKVNKELKPISKEMRAIFDRDSKEGIDEAIRQFRESGRNGE